MQIRMSLIPASGLSGFAVFFRVTCDANFVAAREMYSSVMATGPHSTPLFLLEELYKTQGVSI